MASNASKGQKQQAMENISMRRHQSKNRPNLLLSLLSMFLHIFQCFSALIASSSSPRLAPDVEQARPATSGEEDLQLQLALAMSREESEKVPLRHAHVCTHTHTHKPPHSPSVKKDGTHVIC